MATKKWNAFEHVWNEIRGDGGISYLYAWRFESDQRRFKEAYFFFSNPTKTIISEVVDRENGQIIVGIHIQEYKSAIDQEHIE